MQVRAFERYISLTVDVVSSLHFIHVYEPSSETETKHAYIRWKL